MMKKRCVNYIVLFLYLVFVWTSFIYTKVTTQISTFLIIEILVLIGSVLISYAVFREEPHFFVYTKEPAVESCKSWYFPKISAIVFFVCMIWYMAYCPGGFSNDSLTQLNQCITNTYNDWHPVWHTLCFFKLPLSVVGEYEFIIIAQLIWFSLAIGYMGTTVIKFFGIRPAIYAVLFVILNPYSCLIVLFPWKDVGFAIACLISITITVEIIMTKGRWLDNCYKIIITGFMLVCTILFRHNGILFTIPLCTCILLNCSSHRKKGIYAVAITLLLLLVIRIPLYNIMNVEQPGQRVVEATGLPLTVIGNVVKETPELMDDELKSFAYEIASQEEWDNLYVCGSFNDIKLTGVDTSIVESYGAPRVIGLMCKCFIISPSASVRALLELTDVVYGIDGSFKYEPVYIMENDAGVYYHGNAYIRNITDAYTSLITYSFLKYLWTLGSVVMALVVTFLAKTKVNENWKKTSICLPVLIYDFGTMLLLTGADWRFFYVTYITAPIAVITSLSREGSNYND